MIAGKGSFSKILLKPLLIAFIFSLLLLFTGFVTVTEIFSGGLPVFTSVCLTLFGFLLGYGLAVTRE